MDTKEKLLDVLSEAWEKRKEFCVPHDECETCPYDKYPENCHMYIMFDHLIANGVTVQKHGHWIAGADGSYMCSECGKVFRYEIENYCPHCGAKLDGDEDAFMVAGK